MSMTQGEAVYLAVTEVCGDIDGKYEPTKAQLEAIHERVLSFFKSGQTVHSKNPSEAELRKYIPGLTNNWLRKDLRLNGGSAYVTKRPGIRSGSGDESVKAMKTLLSMTTDPAAKQAIQKEIDKRVQELKPKKMVNIDALPEALRHLVQ